MPNNISSTRPWRFTWRKMDGAEDPKKTWQLRGKPSWTYLENGWIPGSYRQLGLDIRPENHHRKKQTHVNINGCIDKWLVTWHKGILQLPVKPWESSYALQSSSAATDKPKWNINNWRLSWQDGGTFLIPQQIPTRWAQKTTSWWNNTIYNYIVGAHLVDIQKILPVIPNVRERCEWNP